MAGMHINRLVHELEQAASRLKGFEDFRSPVNHAVVVAVWEGANNWSNRTVKVAVREDHGTFYRGRITGTSANGNWDVLADDGELVSGVTADMFVSIRLEVVS